MLDLDYLEDKVPDYINLGETGWAARYYDVHFHLKDRNEYESKKYKMGICDQYIRGMIWTLQYYLTGQPDWTWEYPFHSSPTVHDLLEYVKSPNINNSYKIYRELAIAAGTMTDFENTKKTSERIAIGGLIKANKITKPVSPLEQLMCILPPASSHLLPEPVQQLIKSDALSVYYPEDFALDVFGHRYRWEAHPLLPHIPINEIKAAVSSIEPYLTKEELERNSIGDIFVT
jgi:5'-3' exoribonuclease 2